MLEDGGVFDKKSILMHYYFREAKEFFCVDEVMANTSFNEYIHRNPLLTSSSVLMLIHFIL